MYLEKFIERSRKENNSILNKLLKKNYCLICKHFSNFERVSKNKKEIKRRCKVCNSLARHRMLINYLRNNRNLFNNKKILEIAPSDCTMFFFSKQKKLIHI